MGVRVGVANFESINRYWRDQYISVKIFYLAAKKMLTEMHLSHQNISIDRKQSVTRPPTHKAEIYLSPI